MEKILAIAKDFNLKVIEENIKKLEEFHKTNNSKVTMTAIQPAGRFGALDINSNLVNEFVEKPAGDGSWINGGFMVCEPEVLDLIESDSTVFEKYPLQKLPKFLQNKRPVSINF
mgnify:CR=1 FL=1